jgi:hypothetical protein
MLFVFLATFCLDGRNLEDPVILPLYRRRVLPLPMTQPFRSFTFPLSRPTLLRHETSKGNKKKASTHAHKPRSFLMKIENLFFPRECKQRRLMRSTEMTAILPSPFLKALKGNVSIIRNTQTLFSFVLVPLLHRNRHSSTSVQRRGKARQFPVRLWVVPHPYQKGVVAVKVKVLSNSKPRSDPPGKSMMTPPLWRMSSW